MSSPRFLLSVYLYHLYTFTGPRMDKKVTTTTEQKPESRSRRELLLGQEPSSVNNCFFFFFVVSFLPLPTVFKSCFFFTSSLDSHFRVVLAVRFFLERARGVKAKKLVFPYCFFCFLKNSRLTLTQWGSNAGRKGTYQSQNPDQRGVQT